MDFSFNRLCDGFPVGNKTDGALTLHIITALNDDYELYKDSRCVLESNDNGGQVMLKLPDDKRLASEIRASIQTDKYLRTKGDGSLPSSTRRIHSDLAEENRARRTRLVSILRDAIVGADTFAAGQQIKAKATAPLALLDELMGYLVQNTFSKMSYIKKVKRESSSRGSGLFRLMGKLIDENYSRILIENADLDLSMVMALDKVQKRQPITSEERRALRKQGLVEGRSPNIYVASRIAEITGGKAQYIRNRAFDNDHYKELIRSFIRQYGMATRADIDSLLLDKLSDALTPTQKKNKIGNLLGAMARKDGVIRNCGPDRKPEWILVETDNNV